MSIANKYNGDPREFSRIVMDSAAPVVPVEDFFYDDPNTPWKPLPEHDLKQSPCYPIIDIRNITIIKSHFIIVRYTDIENAYLESIEHHCKYIEPNVHESEILRLLR